MSAKTNSLPAFDILWHYNKLAETEEKFRRS
jgi:hypothetical protein